MKDWRLARSFKDLIKLNIEFLRGNIWASPIQSGPLDDESLPLVEMLIALNSRGLFTTGSQPGGFWEGSKHNAPKRAITRQRAFVMGYCSKPDHARLSSIGEARFFIDPTDVRTTQVRLPPKTEWKTLSGLGRSSRKREDVRWKKFLHPDAYAELAASAYFIGVERAWGSNELWGALWAGLP